MSAKWLQGVVTKRSWRGVAIRPWSGVPIRSYAPRSAGGSGVPIRSYSQFLPGRKKRKGGKNYSPKWSTWLRKNGFQGHPPPKLGVFGVIWVQNSKFFKPGQIIYQNEALGPSINIKWFSRSSAPKLGRLGSFEVKIQRFSNLDSELG